MDGKDPGTGGCHPTGLGDVLQGGGAGGSSIWVRYVGDEPPHGKGPGKFPSKGCQADNGEASEAILGCEMGLPTTGDNDGGGGV